MRLFLLTLRRYRVRVARFTVVTGLVWIYSCASVFAATGSLEIRDAHAYMNSNIATQNIQGMISWVAPAHTEANPITSYQINFYSKVNGENAEYTQIKCSTDIGNSRCSISGTLTLKSAQDYFCTETNQAFLNSLYSVKIQALSGATALGNSALSPLLICDPKQIQETTQPLPSPTQSPISNVNPTPQTSQSPILVPKNSANQSQNTLPESPAGQSTALLQPELPNPPSSPTGGDGPTSSTDSSGTGNSSGSGDNLLKKFGQLGLDLDSTTRKKAKVVVISYMTVAIGLTSRMRG